MKQKLTIKPDLALFFFLMLLLISLQIRGSLPLDMNWYREKLIVIPLVLLSIMIHKIVQNLTAHKLGDMELKINSQKIWNPLLMIDWIGFLPFIFFTFGWAKPIDSLKAISGNKKWVRIQIIGSGILANLFLAILFKWLHNYVEVFSLSMAAYMNIFAIINMNYFLFSLLPIPPLDGWLLFKTTQKGKVKIEKDEVYGYSLILVLFLIKFHQVALEPLSRYLLHWF